MIDAAAIDARVLQLHDGFVSLANLTLREGGGNFGAQNGGRVSQGHPVRGTMGRQWKPDASRSR